MRKLSGFSLLLLVIWLSLALPTSAATQTGTTVRVHPSIVTLQPGQSALIEIWVDDVVDLTAFSVHINFEPASLLVDSLQHGPFLDLAFPEPTNGIDNDQGVIRYGNAQGPSSEPESGSGVLFTFRITANGLGGETPLTITTADLVDVDIFLITCEVAHGTVRVMGEPGQESKVFLPLILR